MSLEFYSIETPAKKKYNRLSDQYGSLKSIINVLEKNFRTRLDKYCRSPIWEFSLEKDSLDTKSFFKYIRFFIKILNLFAFIACFFLILSSFS